MKSHISVIFFIFFVLSGDGFASDSDAEFMRKNQWETFAREWMVAMKPVYGAHKLTFIGFGKGGRMQEDISN